jgi:hypothetical protein
MDITTLTNDELGRELAHARNARDAYSEGRVPADVLTRVSDLLAEQARRRAAFRLDGLNAAVDQAQGELDRHRRHVERLYRYHDECPDGDPRKAQVEKDIDRVMAQVHAAEAAANTAVDALIAFEDAS